LPDALGGGVLNFGSPGRWSRTLGGNSLYSVGMYTIYYMRQIKPGGHGGKRASTNHPFERAFIAQDQLELSSCLALP
jgi:hypothetical protein